jgi:hypothetical protein
MRKRKIRYQRPVKGGRDKVAPSLLHKINVAVQREADRHGVSKSFVIAVILADALGVTEQEQY